MDWNGLHCRFLTATQQEAPPFEEPCVEWDYSRYARALGLTTVPGLHDLTHDSITVAVLPRARWAEARVRMGRWAAEAEWDFVPLSAWPDVVVPDPVIYGLGTQVAGHDAPLWFRAGQQGEPVAHPQRAAGSSMAIHSCERWLIAADRVRRRVRDGLAERGKLIAVEHAELLTPSAISTLRYLVHAQTAWQARMLSAPAPCFVMLIVAPENEDRVRGDLRRFPFQGDPFVWRMHERPSSVRTKNASVLSFEEESMMRALTSAPALLTARDLRAVFGDSCMRVVLSLVDRGILRTRCVRDTTVYEPEPVWCDVLKPAPGIDLAGSTLDRGALVDGRAAADGGAADGGAAVGGGDAVDGRETPSARPQRGVVGVEGAGRAVEEHVHEHANTSEAPEAPEASEATSTAASVANGMGVRKEPGVTREQRAEQETMRRALEAIGTRYRKRQKRRSGHKHLRAAAARVEFALGNRKRAFAHLRNLPQGAPALIPSKWSEKFTSEWETNPNSPSALDLVMRISLLTNRRDYARATDQANAVHAAMIATTHELSRCLNQLVALGRSHLDRIAEPEFWQSFSHSDLIDGATVDAACILAELFARSRWMGRDAGWQRLLAANELMPRGTQSLDRLLATLEERARFDFLIRRGEAPIRVPRVDRHACIAGYIRASVAYSASQYGPCEGRAISEAYEWMGVTGNVEDRRIVTGRVVLYALSRGYRLVVRRLVDEQVLLLGIGTPAELKQRMMVNLRFLAPRVARRLATATLLSGSTSVDALERSVLARDRLFAGDLDGARETLRQCAVATYRSVEQLVVAIWTLGDHALTSFDRESVVLARDLLERHSAELGGVWIRYSDKYLKFVSLLIRGEISEARDAMASVLVALRPVERLTSARFFCASARQWIESLNRLLRANVRKLLAPRRFHRFVSGEMESLGKGVTAGDAADPLLAVLPVIVTALERAAPSSIESDIASCASWLFRRCEATDLGGHGLVSILLAGAPKFFNRLSRALGGEIGRSWMTIGDGKSAVSSGLSAIVRAVPNAQRVEDDSVDRTSCLVVSGSHGQMAKRNYAWSEDAALFHLIVRGTATIRMFGVVGTRTQTTFLEVRRNRRGLQVVRRVSNDFAGPSVAHRGGASKIAQQIEESIRAAAAGDLAVLIGGPTGIGKEVAAREVHKLSSRAGREFVVVDCATIKSEIAEAELFGVCRGAYTGADRARQGLIEVSDGGTLFLDNLDLLTPRVQTALLRVLESGEYRRVGATKASRADLRVIASLSGAIDEVISSGEIREDLLYRLRVLEIDLPGLDRRKEDILWFSRRWAKRKGLLLSRSAEIALLECSWPGNYRELGQCLEVIESRATSGQVSGAHVREVKRLGSLPERDSVDAALRSLFPGPFSSIEFAERCKSSRRTAQRRLAGLVNLGVLRRVGFGRATSYAEQP